MRKKSHISLARYMVNCLNDDELRKHRWSFYIGSVLPDMKPSFLYKRHEITGTFSGLSQNIARLSEGEKVLNKRSRKYYRDLGQISHYLADYFTFPHNDSYTGSLKDHCFYEKKLKYDLRTFVNTVPAMFSCEPEYFNSAKALCDYIQDMHDEYIMRKHDVEDDIRHIVEINQQALNGMIVLLAQRRLEFAMAGRGIYHLT